MFTGNPNKAHQRLESPLCYASSVPLSLRGERSEGGEAGRG